MFSVLIMVLSGLSDLNWQNNEGRSLFDKGSTKRENVRPNA